MSQPGLIPLVILRGSGETTAALAREAAAHGVRTLAHAEGGGVLYVDRAPTRRRRAPWSPRSLDRLGVCNRLNLLLVDAGALGRVVARASRRSSRSSASAPSLPPHDHPLGHEWALDDGAEATVTLAPAAGAARRRARSRTPETSGLAAAIVTEDAAAAGEFLAAYAGTGAFWNATTRLLDGFELLGAPETGINVDHVPGPRGPVTFRDLHLRQYVVVPEGTPRPREVRVPPVGPLGPRAPSGSVAIVRSPRRSRDHSLGEAPSTTPSPERAHAARAPVRRGDPSEARHGAVCLLGADQTHVRQRARPRGSTKRSARSRCG